MCTYFIYLKKLLLELLEGFIIKTKILTFLNLLGRYSLTSHSYKYRDKNAIFKFKVHHITT